jgi:hypothetical protein
VVARRLAVAQLAAGRAILAVVMAPVGWQRAAAVWRWRWSAGWQRAWWWWWRQLAGPQVVAGGALVDHMAQRCPAWQQRRWW